MKENFVVSATPRTAQGKSASRRLRREGLVPGILYGGGAPAESIAINHSELRKHLQTEAFYSRILSVQLGQEAQQAVLKDLQRHPVRDQILHIDFQRIRADQTLRMHVPLHFAGGDVCPGVKTGGGVVEHHMIQIEVECLPKDLPEYLQVDLSRLDVNESVHLSQLTLPEGVELVELKHGNDASVAAVHLPRVAVEAEEVAETAEAAPAEGTTEAKAPAAGAAKPAEGKAEDKKTDKK
ncbi:MAG: 50S ribosomal protein L25/general stress protein Ctc [Gammaproteobacteria bacterium]|nr:50S ribosomal protein L25/general stress protein Ctc [Gammaproteobacteria bacterium]